MNYFVRKSSLSGVYKGTPSKSISHRILLLSTLLNEFKIQNFLISNDTLETIDFVKHLGFKVETLDDYTIVKRIKKVDDVKISLKESASTLRFIIPFSMVHLNSLEITYSDNLRKRFKDIYHEIFKDKNVKYQFLNDNSIKVSGKLESGSYHIPKTVSSQFVSGLLLTLPFIEGDSSIIINKVPSKPYLDLTVNLLKKLGIKIRETKEGYFIKGSQTIKENIYIVENDYSNASFFIAANKLGSNIKIEGLNQESFQGDKIIDNILNQKEINLLNNPDLAPILFTYAALQNHNTTFTGFDNLVYKESDRLKNMLENLKLVNANFKLDNNNLTFYPSKLRGGVKVLDYNDHRIAMSMIILGSFLDEGIIINSINSINKSYPTFVKDFKSLGGIIDVK